MTITQQTRGIISSALFRNGLWMKKYTRTGFEHGILITVEEWKIAKGSC